MLICKALSCLPGAGLKKFMPPAANAKPAFFKPPQVEAAPHGSINNLSTLLQAPAGTRDSINRGGKQSPRLASIEANFESTTLRKPNAGK